MTWASDLEIEIAGPGVARIGGWALPPDGPINRVELLADGRVTGRVFIGVYRPGVAKISDRPDAPVCGFSRTVSVGAAEELTVRIVSAGGEQLEFPPQPVIPALPRPPADPFRPVLQPHAGPIRVAAYGDYARSGGAQRVLADLLRGMGSDGIECRMFTPSPEAAGPAASAAPLETVPEPPLSDPPAFESWLGGLAERFRPFDVVVADTFGAFAAIPAANRAGVPAVWAVHESVPPVAWITEEAVRRDIAPEVGNSFDEAIRRAAAMVFVSTRARDAFLDDVPDAPAHALPYGVDADRMRQEAAGIDRRAFRAEAGYADDEILVACLSMVGFGKGQSRLAQAFDLIADRHPRARLVMVGDRGLRYADGIREFIRRTGRDDRIRVLPATDAVAGWHVAADVVVLASSVEMLPRVMVEAMIAGRPVAATDVFGAGEYIEDGVTGYLCQPDDLLELSGMLDRVLSAGPTEWQRISSTAGLLVDERFMPSRWIGQWTGLIGSVAGTGP